MSPKDAEFVNMDGTSFNPHNTSGHFQADRKLQISIHCEVHRPGQASKKTQLPTFPFWSHLEKVKVASTTAIA